MANRSDTRLEKMTSEEVQGQMLGALQEMEARVRRGEVHSLYILSLHNEQCDDPDCPGMHFSDFYRGRRDLVGGVARKLSQAAAEILPLLDQPRNSEH